MAITKLIILAKTYGASREDKTELLILVSDLMVNSRLKILNGISMDFIECLNKTAKKKGHFLYIRAGLF